MQVVIVKVSYSFDVYKIESKGHDLRVLKVLNPLNLWSTVPILKIGPLFTVKVKAKS